MKESGRHGRKARSRKEGRKETLKLRKFLTQQIFVSFLAYVKEVNKARK